MRRLRFIRMTGTLYASDDYRYFIEKEREGGWLVTESGVGKNRLPTLNEAKAWLRAWDKGEVLAFGAHYWWRPDA